ncbi:MAG: hypothetical protein RRY29_01980 [Desulfovibrionaceae bacterium]
MSDEVRAFLDEWTADPLNAKLAFTEFWHYLSTLAQVECSFKARPQVSYSLRASYVGNTARPLFVLVDVVDDEPETRWLSVCFYADMVTDPEELGDFVPEGLMGKDACCLNLEEDDTNMRAYIMARIKEAAHASVSIQA